MPKRQKKAGTRAGLRHRLIGLTGTNGAGKGVAAAYLMKKGYAYVSLSDEIRDELRRKGMKITRDNLIATGNALRRKHGADVLARRVMKKVKGPTVIDSIRNAREVAFLRRRRGFLLVALDAPLELRYGRIQKRGRLESASSLEEFAAKEKEEMAGGASGQQLGRCLELADVTIRNDGSLAALHRRIEERL
jgi:dephospho-CoA kinase